MKQGTTTRQVEKKENKKTLVILGFWCMSPNKKTFIETK